MTEYISNAVKILNLAEISWSAPEKFEISVDYYAPALSEYSISKNTLTTTLTITNFTGNTPFNLASDIICEVGSSVDNMVNITTLTDLFSISVSSVDPTQYNVTVTVNSAADLYASVVGSTSLGDLRIGFRLSESFLTALTNDGYDVWPFYRAPDYAFRTNFGNPPKSIITSQPENAIYSDGASTFTFEIRFDTYNGNLSIGDSWQYSDDYGPVQNEDATWLSVPEGSLVASSVNFGGGGGDWGFGENSNSPIINDYTKTLTIPQSQYEQNPFRYYRYKFVVT